MEANVSEDNSTTIPDDLVPILTAAKLADIPYSSLYGRIRKGKVPIYFISGDTQAKVSLSYVKKDKAIMRHNFSAPLMRIVRLDPNAADQSQKEDLFA
jgi:hypothetical protein